MERELMVVENFSGKSVDYQIHVGIDYAKVVDLQSKWGAYRADLLSALITANPGMATDNELARKILADNSLSDWHWDWCRKLLQCNGDDYQWFFLQINNAVQGVCVLYHPKESRFDNNKIFYVDYIATAYWNRPRPNFTPKYSGVGKELIQHTINYACSNWGYRPGFCLHALPSAEGFYNHLGMTDFGVDHEKENLRFYEASQVVASTLGGISNAA